MNFLNNRYARIVTVFLILQGIVFYAVALRAGGCRGCSIGVYNTNLDPGGHAATRIVAFVADVAAHARPG